MDNDALNLLLNSCELDTYLDKKKQEQKELNARLEKELIEREEAKEVERMSRFYEKQTQAIEQYSNFILKDGRILSNDKVEELMTGRKYISFSSLEEKITPETYDDISFFSIAILCDKSPPRVTKNDEKYIMCSFTDLNKCFSIKKAHRATEGNCGFRSINNTLSSTYNNTKLMAYREAFRILSNASLGTVYCLINVRPLKKKDGFTGYTLIAENECHIVEIGKSADFDLCKFPGSCRIFVNKSIEAFCDHHKTLQINQIKNSRPYFQSTYIDKNSIRNGGGNDQNKLMTQPPKQRLTKDEKEKLVVKKKLELDNLDQYLKKRIEMKDKISYNPISNLTFGSKKSEEVKKVVKICELSEEQERSAEELVKNIMMGRKQKYNERFQTADDNIIKKPKLE